MLALVGAVGLTSMMPASMSPSSPAADDAGTAISAPPAEAAVEPMEFEGPITGWRLDADGTVRFRIQATDPKPIELWFRSPPNRSSTTQMEGRLMDAILHAEGPVRVSAHVDSLPKTPDTAVELRWLSSR